MNKLHDYQKTSLAPLEKALKKTVADAEPDTAIETAGRIRALFPDDLRHPRLLRAKLWAFEACVDANRLSYAEAGLVGIRKLSGPKTRLHLEASGLLAVVLLRFIERLSYRHSASRQRAGGIGDEVHCRGVLCAGKAEKSHDLAS